MQSFGLDQSNEGFEIAKKSPKIHFNKSFNDDNFADFAYKYCKIIHSASLQMHLMTKS